MPYGTSSAFGPRDGGHSSNRLRVRRHLHDRGDEADLEKHRVGQLNEDRRGKQPPRHPTAHTVTRRSTKNTTPIVTQNRDQRMLSAASRVITINKTVGPQRHHPVSQRSLLGPVHRRRPGRPVGAEVLQRSAVPAESLAPQVSPPRHHLGRHSAFRRRRQPGAEGLQGKGELVVLGQRQGVVDLTRVPGISVPRASATALSA